VLLAVIAVPFLVRAWNRRRGARPEGADAEDELSESDRDRLDRELEAFDG